MRRLLVLLALAGSVTVCPAVLLELDLGPGGLNGNNEVPANSSSATGGETGAGITYDTDSNTLTLNFAYGSAFGFVDLESDWNGGIHIHGPAGVGSTAGVLFNLASIHTANGTRSGSVSGVVNYSDAQEADLLAGRHYINIHTADHPAGEIRGQLLVVPEPQTYALLTGFGLGVVVLARRFKRA